MAIYVRNKDGGMDSLKIVGLKGDKGQDGVTPNITIGTVTTLEPNQQATVTKEGTKENPIFNFGIPKGEKGADGTSSSDDGASIDDSTISTNKTWSSSKIEDFALNNDNAIRTIAQGENLGVEYTKEGYLREVEVFGNTVQGYENLITNEQLANSVNSVTWVKAFGGCNPLVEFNGDTFRFKDFCGSPPQTILEDIKNSENIQPIKLEPNTTYSLCLKGSNTTNFNAFSKNKHLGKQVFTTDSTGDVIIIVSGAHYGGNHIKLVRGNVPNLSKLDWDYDLEHVESLGKLYTDRSGEPILDKHGRKQYKINIEISSANLGEYELEVGALNYNTGLNVDDDNTKFRTKDFIKLNNWLIDSHQNITNTYGYGNNPYTYIFYNKDKKYIGWKNITQLKEVDIPIGAEYFKFFTLYREGVLDKGAFQSNVWYSKKPKESYCKSKRHKTTILLPCQLMKVGNISDRLYWDGSKGRYVVEKNIFNTGYIDRITGIDDGGYPKTNTQRFMVSARNSETINMNGTVFAMSPDIQFVTTSDWGKDIPSIQFDDKRTNIRLLRTVANTVEEANIYLNTHPIHYYFISKTPQLIDTDIREELKLPTYINNTYISVNGGIQGSIKAKAPVDGGKVIANLQRENVELKATNDTQDELINTTMLATDEMFMMLEPLLAEAVNLNERSISKMVDMYVAMVQRGIKTIDQVPARYREQVKEVLAQLDN